MKASGDQLRERAALVDAEVIRPVVDFPFSTSARPMKPWPAPSKDAPSRQRRHPRDMTAPDLPPPSPGQHAPPPAHRMRLHLVGTPAGERPALVRIAPSGHRTVLVTGQKGDGITGNTRGHDGTVYYNVWSSDASRNGVWKLPPGGTPHRIAALPAGGVPNGLAIDPAGRTLYVADSQKGAVWAVPVAGGPATAWLVDPALAIEESAPVPYGANGLRFHNGAVWVSNLSKGTLLRVPVTATGTPGRIHTVADGLTGIDDFNFLSDHSNVVFAALNTQNKIAVVYPNGSTRTVLTASDGLASPTATAVRGKRLYITDGGLNEPHDAQVQSGKIDLGALLSH